MVKIPDEIIKSVKLFKKNIKKDLAVKRVILFGSYAKGKYTADSDIDVCVVAQDIQNNYLAMLRIVPLTIDINPRIEPVVISDIEYSEEPAFGLIREIKQSGIEI